MYGHPSGTGKLAVYLSYKSLYLSFKLLVLFHLFAARHHNLNQSYITPQVGESLQSVSECLKALRYALGVVKPVNSQYDLFVGEILVDVPRPVCHFL